MSAGRPSSQVRAVAPTAARVVLDSSCWLEFFADTPRGDLYAEWIDRVDELVVPIITVYEIVKKLAREVGDDTAAMALSLMQRGQVVMIDLDIALLAATYPLPMADSLIYATAQSHNAVLWTQDAHFAGLTGVNYLAKPASAPVQ